MKFTATTSSLLFASMALSPSLASAAPTGMEAPNSPNPAGSPSIRQFSPSPRFVPSRNFFNPSPKMNRAPALRTGPGSPRRSIPARMLKVHRRDDAAGEASAYDASAGPLDSTIDPITGLLKTLQPLLSPVTGALEPVASPVLDPLTGLPVVGGVVSKVGAGLGIMGADVPGQAASSVLPSQTGGDNLATSSSNLLGSALPFDADQMLDGIPFEDGFSGLAGSPQRVAGSPYSGSASNPIAGLTGTLPFSQIASPIGGLFGSLPGLDGFPSIPSPQFSGAVSSLPNIPSYGSIPIHPEHPSAMAGVPGQYLPHPANRPQAPGAPAPPRIIAQTPDGQLIEEFNGILSKVPFPNVINQSPYAATGLVSAESEHPAPPPSPASPVSASMAPPSAHTVLSGTPSASAVQSIHNPASLPIRSSTTMLAPTPAITPSIISSAAAVAVTPLSSVLSSPSLATPPQVDPSGQPIEFSPEGPSTYTLVPAAPSVSPLPSRSVAVQSTSTAVADPSATAPPSHGSSGSMV